MKYEKLNCVHNNNKHLYFLKTELRDKIPDIYIATHGTFVIQAAGHRGNNCLPGFAFVVRFPEDVTMRDFFNMLLLPVKNHDKSRMTLGEFVSKLK